MIWFSGNTGAGKTTLSRKYAKATKLAPPNEIIILDGDEVRDVWPGLSHSKEDRYTNAYRIANLALLLEKQGFLVIVASICPYRELQAIIREMTKCTFCYVTGGKKPDGVYPYEIPINPDIVFPGNV